MYSDKTISKELFEDFLSIKNVIRAKGFVNFSDGTRQPEMGFRKMGKKGTEIVFIGKKLKKIQEEINNRFE